MVTEQCCVPEVLCDRCYERELGVKRRQSEVIGQCWAESVALRSVEARSREAWPDDERALRMAEVKVKTLARDSRMLGELAKACISGAAAWWERRPERYRKG